MLILFVGMGLGSPRTYWQRIGDMQAFEGPDRLVLFVEVRRAMRWPGLISSKAINLAAGFLRVDVFPDGRVERKDLRYNPEDHLTLNTNIGVVLKLVDAFHLARTSNSTGERRLYRLGPDQITALFPTELEKALSKDGPLTFDSRFDLSSLDSISIRNGWRRIDDEGSNTYESIRLGVRIRHRKESWEATGPEVVVAESLTIPGAWSRTLITVDRRRWTSYKDPGNRKYLRQKYAETPPR